MELITILNQCYRQKGFVYREASFVGQHRHQIEVSIVPRKRSKANCSGCGKPCPGYDRLPSRRYEFIPFWGFKVFLVYAKRRVQCRDCGVVTEAVPWARGKHHLCDAYMLYLADWARKLSWKEVAQRFKTSWEKVFHSVEYVVNWGLEHRDMNDITAIGVDEVQWHKGHRYLTLVYQIDSANTRLLWIGKAKNRGDVSNLLRSTRRSSGATDSIRLFRYVEALSESDQRTSKPCAAYIRPVSHRVQTEQSAGRSTSIGTSADETRWVRTGIDQIKMAATQTSGKPNANAGHQVTGVVAIQFKEYSSLSIERRISTPMGLCIPSLGREIY